MTGDGFDNLDALRIRDDDIPVRMEETPVARRHQVRQLHAFIQTPLDWSQRLARPTHAYTRAVADCLLHLEWKGKGGPVALSNLALKPWGVSPREKSRALKELEGLGLIAIDRSRGKSPRVTLFKRGTRMSHD